MMRLSRLAVICVLILTGSAERARGGIVTIDTADHFTPGVKSQGWWSGTYSRTVGAADNYITGRSGAYLFRNFFTFDLDSLDLTGQQIVSATLEVTLFTAAGVPHSLSLHDVITPAAPLNQAYGISQTIYDDLGSGTHYGTFTVNATDPSSLISMQLNAAALADITNAAGGYFSIGGSLDLSDKPVRDNHLFRYSAYDQDHRYKGTFDSIQRLTIELEPNSQFVAPEPSSVAVFGLGAIGLAVGGIRRRKRQAAAE